MPITTPEQREVLQAAHRLAGAGSLIPAHKNYIQQRHTYDGQCKAAGLSNMHGLRHQYAQMMGSTCDRRAATPYLLRETARDRHLRETKY